MKKDMPLEGLRWSRDSGSALYDTPQNGRSRTGWGGSSMNYLKQALRNVCWKTFVYEDLKIKPFKLLSTFISDEKLSTLNEISMSDFQFEKVLIGKYTAKLIDAQIPFDLIQEYSENMSKFKACIQVEDAEAQVTIKSKNSMVISCEEEDKYTIFDYLSSKIY